MELEYFNCAIFSSCIVCAEESIVFCVSDVHLKILARPLRYLRNCCHDCGFLLLFIADVISHSRGIGTCQFNDDNMQ